MIRSRPIVLILFLGYHICQAQLPADFPSITVSDLPGVTITEPRIFTGRALFGYINGGAELYLEYGFEAVTVVEIDYMKGRYKTEIYKMMSPEAAFGIFSVSKYRCLDMPDISRFTCRTRYQFQVCKGHYYVSIINRTGTRADSIASDKIARIIAGKINEKELDLSEFLPDVPLESIRKSASLAKGRLGIVNGQPDLEDYFKGGEDYTVVIYKGDDDRTVSIRFGDPGSLSRFVELRGWIPANLSQAELKLPTGETVRKISDYQLYIKIPNQ
jgi:hypothetical protein